MYQDKEMKWGSGAKPQFEKDLFGQKLKKISYLIFSCFYSSNNYTITMTFSKGLFRDTDETKLDYEKHAGQIIPRVFMRGTIDDMKQVLLYYGREKVKHTLLQTRYLDKTALAFSAGLFNLHKEDFRCYKLSQSIPQLWNY
ncbi:hypothetical protein AGMMS50249_0150 [candidate division SR1 bacterium]|nr:hypothetical protein AGMMS50249_0150 [candidate division SR1 bacterium]